MKKNRNISEDSPIGSVRVGRLDDLRSIRAELAKLYRNCRATAGKNVDPRDGGRLAFLLNSLATHVQTQDLEARVKALEERLGNA